MSTMITGVVVGIIGIVIAIIFLTSLGETIITNTDTGTASSLENASSTSKTMYSLIELLYPIMGVLFMVAVGFSLGRRH